MGVRSALIVATSTYADPGLPNLRAPARDVQSLRDVLADPRIGRFDVTPLIDATEPDVRRAVAGFFADRASKDLLLLHFSCHGLKDRYGRLFLAARDTELTLLSATATPAQFIKEQMAECSARSIVLLLDCCYSGAFSRDARADRSINLVDEFGTGTGRAVLTASSAIQYAIENDRVEVTGDQPSIFTRSVVRGLESGEADLDGDGEISIDELYQYVHDEVRRLSPVQTPQLSTTGLTGRIVIARSVRPARLPADLRHTLDSPSPAVRVEAVAYLRHLLDSRSAALRDLAVAHLRDLASSDDSIRVRDAASAALQHAGERSGPPDTGSPLRSSEIQGRRSDRQQQSRAVPPSSGVTAPQSRPSQRELSVSRPEPLPGAPPSATPGPRPVAGSQAVGRPAQAGGARSAGSHAPQRRQDGDGRSTVTTRPRPYAAGLGTRDPRLRPRQVARWATTISTVLLLGLGALYVRNAINPSRGIGGGAAREVKVRQGGTLTAVLNSEPTGFNFNTATDQSVDTRVVTVQVLPALYNQSPGYVATLGPAFESAGVTSHDPQTVTIKIKPAAKWSDGVPISAADFRYVWENRIRPENDTISTAAYESIASVTGSADGKTVTIVFKKRFADWKGLFTDILPAHVMKERPGGWSGALRETIPVSGGPFKLERFTRGREIVLVRNDAFWAEKPKLDRIVFRMALSSSDQLAQLRDGTVDLIAPLWTSEVAREVGRLSGVTSQVSPSSAFENLVLNFKNTHLAKAQVRKAIAKGIDREELARRVVGPSTPPTGRLDNHLWLPGQPEHESHDGDYAERDVAGARALLGAAGYKRGSDGFYELAGKRLSLNISTVAGNSSRELAEEFIAAQLKEVGIELKVQNFDAAKLFGEQLPGGDYDVALFAWIGSLYPTDNLEIYTSSGVSNYGKYQSKRTDDLFKQASEELDRGKFVTLVNRIDEQLWQDMATIPLYQRPSVIAYRDDLGNIVPNGTYDEFFAASYRWGFKEQ